MIGYVTIGTNDLPRASAFYDALLGIVGAKRSIEMKTGVGWATAADKPMVSVMLPFDGKPATVGNGSMVSLAATNAEQVQALYDKALALGGTDEGPPGSRGGNFYAAYFRDLDGNKLGAFCMTA